MPMTGVWLPPDIWGVVLGFSPDAETFLSLAMVWKDFASLAREEKVQETVKRQFAREIEEDWHGMRGVHFALPNGTKHGPWATWHPNGNKCQEGMYRDGEQEGMRIWWDDNEKKRKEGKYRYGKEEGTWKTWHPNGQIETEGPYLDGKPEGLWTWSVSVIFLVALVALFNQFGALVVFFNQF